MRAFTTQAESDAGKTRKNLARLQRETDFQFVLNMPQGRRMLTGILHRLKTEPAGRFYQASATMQEKAVRLDAALEIEKDIQAANPNALMMMATEAHQARKLEPPETHGENEEEAD